MMSSLSICYRNGLAPGFVALGTNVNYSLKEGGRSGSASGGHARLRSALVVLEIAIALILLAASGLLLHSFSNMSAVDLGFRPDHVTTVAYSLPQKQYSTQAEIDGRASGRSDPRRNQDT
jgi:putative ABC transport system permease protein